MQSNKYSQASQILLNCETIKMLDSQSKNKLIQAIQQADDWRSLHKILNEFYYSSKLEISQLEKQVTRKTFKKKKILDLKSLLILIVKTRYRQDQHFCQTVKSKILNMQSAMVKRQQIITKLLTQYRPLFQIYFQQLLTSNSVTLKDIQYIPLFSDLQQYFQMQKSLQSKASLEQTWKEMLIDANYLVFINKNQIADAVKMLQLLQTALEQSQKFKNKQIIAFFGNTGSGKSTTVNYLLGVPLEKKVQKHGEQVIQISRSGNSDFPEGEFSKIGHGVGTSQTLYSKGFPLNPNKFQNITNSIENIQLCDNPGFMETRGNIYEICTDFSIDQSIDQCESIKAIVLIIPYQSILLDRGSHLIELIISMQNSFVYLEDRQSGVFKSFHIFITKAPGKFRLGHFLQTIITHLEQLKSLQQLNRKNYLQSKYNSQKIKVLQDLVVLHGQERVFIIDVEDPFQRETIMDSLLSCQAVSKDQYFKKFHTKALLKKLTDYLLVLTHSWTEMIFKNHQELIPNEIQKNNLNLAEIISEISKNQAKIEQLKDALRDKKKTEKKQLQSELQILQKQMKRAQNNQFTDLQMQAFFQIDQQKEDINQKIEKQQQKLAKSHKKLAQLKASLIQGKNKQAEISKCIKHHEQVQQKYEQNLAQMKKKFHKQTLFHIHYKLQEEVDYQGYTITTDQALDLLEKSQQLPGGKHKVKFLAGKKSIGLITNMTVARRYRLLPSEQFDPDSYIEASTRIFGDYQAEIQSRNVTLQGIKLKQGGNAFIVCIREVFIWTKSQKRLPFLKITHKVPGYIYYQIQIQNMQADQKNNRMNLKKHMSEMQAVRKRKSYYLREIEQQNNLIAERQKKIVAIKTEYEQLKKKIEQTRDSNKQLKIKAFKQKKQADYSNKLTQIENIQKQVANIKEEIQRKQLRNITLNAQKKEVEQLIGELVRKHKRLAFLIKDQFLKGMPYTLEKLIRIVMIILEERKQLKQLQKISEQFNLKIESFKQYLEVFASNKDYLLKQIVST